MRPLFVPSRDPGLRALYLPALLWLCLGISVVCPGFKALCTPVLALPEALLDPQRPSHKTEYVSLEEAR